MQPAYSVILFTTTSGAGYGLLFWLCLLGPNNYFMIQRDFSVASFGLAFGLITIGLLSSTFHLGHPERAWRAFSQWRTSWLSREGVAAVLTYIPASLVAIAWVYYDGPPDSVRLLGYGTAVLCIITIGCTAMIYASLRTIRQWHHPLVLPVYLSLGLATGALLLTLLVLLFDNKAGYLRILTIALFIIAAILKLAYWWHLGRQKKNWTIEQATGLKSSTSSSTVSQLESPHFQDNFVMREMGYKIGRKHARKLKFCVAVLTFAAPISLYSLDILTHTASAIHSSVLGVACVTVGVIIERWLFFAEAQHVVTLYYGAERA